jgi:hypothetical protein
MSDDASRQWDLTGDEMLTQFNSSYPQATCWILSPLLPVTNTALIGALPRKTTAQRHLPQQNANSSVS